MREQAKRLIGPRATVRLRSLMRGYDRPRPDFARPHEPALERSRFAMLAEVFSAELAHRMAYA